jgi:hypothetical protein
MDGTLRPKDGTAQAASDGTVTTFEATFTSGYVATGTDDPDNNLTLIEEGATAEMTGEIHADGTWRSTDVSWPPIDPEVDLPPGVEFEIAVDTDGPVEGEFDPEAGSMTADLPLRIVIDVSVVVKSLQVELEVDAENLTTGESNAMTGTAEGLDTETATVRLVDNELTVEETGTDAIDEKFALPALEPGTNWVELAGELELAEPVERA